ncbi:sporulation integral membrane protein YtvI [Candidatus Arthromitus sp. SFB-turkey]|uniref:sporulation integral membrane protein YtvI n=1 Tax=Candidatus Arthromitus sp. SFB-turkey TaxID=1840217 RepID=UPI0007F33E0B|nr:sporulation integral membrane protein YtvI [Candidatus Arthromitus sp. SFB-turkey]OAT87942.1 sporulation integral membrane protein YtvI [Candidatus Arthromitus sp. SFB-turkey]
MDNINKQKIFIIKFLYFILILGIIFSIFKYALPVLFPFLVAFSISIILRHPVDFISKHLKINRKFVGVLLLLLLYGSISFVFIFFGTKLFRYIGELFQKLPEIYTTNIEPALNIIIYKIQDIIPELNVVLDLENISKYIINIINSISLSAVNLIASIATKIPSFLVKFIFAIIASFLCTLDYYKVTGFIMRQFPERVQEIIINVKQNIFGTIVKFLKAYSILMFVTFIQLSIGLTIFNIPNAITLAVIFSMLDVLPAIGVGGLLIPWSIIEFIKGNYDLAIGLLVIYGIISIVRSILEPKVIGKQIGLNPLITLTSMFLGAEILGFFGIFIFPIIATIIKYLNDSGTLKLFK